MRHVLITQVRNQRGHEDLGLRMSQSQLTVVVASEATDDAVARGEHEGVVVAAADLGHEIHVGGQDDLREHFHGRDGAAGIAVAAVRTVHRIGVRTIGTRAICTVVAAVAAAVQQAQLSVVVLPAHKDGAQ